MKHKFIPFVLFLFFVAVASAQNVGVGTNSPGTKLHVNGAIASTPSSGPAGATITIPANVTIYRITDDGAVAANAVTATSPVEGQFLTIYNTDAQAATFTASGATQTIGAVTGVMTFEYINGAWQMISDNTAGGGNYIKNQTSADQTGAGFRTVGNGLFNSTTAQVAIGTATPASGYQLTLTPNSTNGGGISIAPSGASGNGINISYNSSAVNGINVSNASTATSANFYGIGGILSTTHIVSGYLGYRTSGGSSSTSYGIYGINGAIGSGNYVSTDANTWAGFFQGRTVVSSETAPSSPVGTDLEIRNTTSGGSAPATVSLRQTTSTTTSGTVLTDLNFGDNYQTGPQAQIAVLRDATASGTSYPTAITFSTTPATTTTMAERMRISNSGNVGIGINAPTSSLHIVQPAASTGSPTALTVTGGAHTTLTASTEAPDVNLNLARTVQFATGALTTQRAVRIQAPTYSFVGASTITNAATLDISGAPVAGTNATITNNAALVVESGNTGLGTTSPAQRLEVGGNNQTIRVDGLTSTVANQFATAGTQQLYTTASGDLTVVKPTTAPSNTINWTVYGNATSASPAVPATYGTSTFGSTDNWLGTSSAYDLALGTSNIERMRILASGKVGIGTAAPTQALHVYTATNATGILLDGPASGTSIAYQLGEAGTVKASVGLTGTAGDWTSGSAVGDLVIRDVSQKILFNTNGGTAIPTMSISGSNVGINQSSPTYELDVTNPANANADLGLTAGTSTTSATTGVPRIQLNDWYSGTKTTSEIVYDFYGNYYASSGGSSHGLSILSGRSGYDNIWFRNATGGIMGGFVNPGYSTSETLVTTDNLITGGKIGVGTPAPAASALVDMTSTSLGFLPPRMSAPNTAISSPAEGLIAYNTTDHALYMYNGTVWQRFVMFQAPGTQSYTSAGSYTWVVPDGMTSITIDMQGGVGGSSAYNGASGGQGGRIQTTMQVIGGEVLYIGVGGAGSNGSGTTGGGGGNGGYGNDSYGGAGAGGQNGQGLAGGGGGGATDIRIGGTAQSNRILVAGGGGGGGNDMSTYYNGTAGGNGGSGATSGVMAGANGGYLVQASDAGQGGTTSGPGATTTGYYNGSCPYGQHTGTGGSGSTGGAGGWQGAYLSGGSCYYEGSGGGGAGGYYGGGGGASGGGGGGSSYIVGSTYTYNGTPYTLSGTSTSTGNNGTSGNGYVTITWQ